MSSKLLRLLSLAFACLVALFLVPPSNARAQTTRNVGPGQPYTTIQSAIDAAQNGDTVLVAPGTYTENINFKGKAITVTSSGGPSVTTIDGAGKAPTATFNTAETRGAILSNFTLQHGGILDDPIVPPYGGIYVHGSSPTIRNNVLTQNNCWSIIATAAAPLIQNNVISATRDPDGRCYAFGGGSGIFIYANLNNSKATNDGTSALIEGNTIENNVESGYEDAGGSGGAGIAAWSGSPVILNNIIRNNATLSGSGGAINFVDAAGVAVVQNLIYGNSAGCAGGGITLPLNSDPRTGISALVANNTIVNNTGKSLGGTACDDSAQIYPSPGTYGLSHPSDILINNIISGSTPYPAVDCSIESVGNPALQPLFGNNILFNAGGPFFGISCIDVSGSNGNIAADPQFVNPAIGDFHLQSTSPAIDHGQNNVQQLFQSLTGLILNTDFDGNPRIQDATGHGCNIDMGAYEHPGSQSICGTQLTLSSSLNPSILGQTVTFTAQLTTQNGPLTGTLTFADGSTFLNAQSISTNGTSTFNTNQLTVGTHTITATFQPTGSGPSASASLPQVVNGYSTTTALSSSINPAITGQTVTFTASITSQSGTPTGTVTFTEAGKTLVTQPVASGTATYTTATLSIGLHRITAAYNPSGNYAGSSDTLTETINGQPTSTALSITPNPATAFGTLTLTSTVSAAGAGTPSGTVTFSAGTLNLGTASLGTTGQAVLKVAAPSPGTYSITAAYSGDAVFNTSTSPSVSETVLAAPTSITLTSSPNPAYQSQPVTLSAQVTGTTGQTPTGLITFSDGETLLGNGTLSPSGTASLSVTSLAPGTHTLAAGYAGAGSYAASTSAPLQQVILPGTFGLTLSPSSITLHSGQQGAVQVALSSVGGFSGPLTLTSGPMPTYTSATLTPTTVSLAAGGNGSANLLLNTAMAHLEPTTPLHPNSGIVVFAAIGGLLLPLRSRARARRLHFLGLVLLMLTFIEISGCGTIGVPFHTTAPGTYLVPITGTDTHGNSHSATLTITVTQ